MLTSTQLSLHVTLLDLGGRLCVYMRLPRRRTNVLDAVGVFKDFGNLLKRLARGLGEQEEDVDSHDKIEDAKDDVGAVADVLKGWGRKQTKGGVEGPVEGGGEGHALASKTEGEQLGRIDPGHGTPRWGVRGYEEICAGNHGLGGRACHLHGYFGDVVDSAGDNCAVGAENTGVGKHKGRHEESADDESLSSTPAIYPE